MIFVAFLIVGLPQVIQTFCLGNHSVGEWRDMKKGDSFPSNAVEGGNERKSTLYICRAYDSNEHCGKASTFGLCWVPDGDWEKPFTKFQVLTEIQGVWAPVFNASDSLPCNVFKVGERDGKDLYSGRKHHTHKRWSNLVLGEVKDSVNTITYGHRAYSSEENYEIFTAVPNKIILEDESLSSKTYKTDGNYITFSVQRNTSITIFLGTLDKLDYEISVSSDSLELNDLILGKTVTVFYDRYIENESFWIYFKDNTIRIGDGTIYTVLEYDTESDVEITAFKFQSEKESVWNIPFFDEY